MSLSRSVPASVPVMSANVSSPDVSVREAFDTTFNTGASFAPSMLSVKVCELVKPAASVTVSVKNSEVLVLRASTALSLGANLY